MPVASFQGNKCVATLWASSLCFFFYCQHLLFKCYSCVFSRQFLWNWYLVFCPPPICLCNESFLYIILQFTWDHFSNLVISFRILYSNIWSDYQVYELIAYSFDFLNKIYLYTEKTTVNKQRWMFLKTWKKSLPFFSQKCFQKLIIL